MKSIDPRTFQISLFFMNLFFFMSFHNLFTFFFLIWMINLFSFYCCFTSFSSLYRRGFQIGTIFAGRISNGCPEGMAIVKRKSSGCISLVNFFDSYDLEIAFHSNIFTMAFLFSFFFFFYFLITHNGLS